MTPNSGVICVYKPPGITSHKAAAAVKRVSKLKTGHTGTLDPQAEGILPILLGSATRLADYMSGSDKSYEVEVLFGRETDTQDAAGLTTREEAFTASEAEFMRAVSSFEGAYNQKPPMYSALKVKGQKLYELARKGVTIERQARPVHIRQITVISAELPVRAVLSVRCSKGTYMRTLCEDLGRRLGACAHMGRLIRTEAAGFTLSDAVPLDGDLLSALLPPERIPALRNYRRFKTTREADVKALNGGRLRPAELLPLLDGSAEERSLPGLKDGEPAFVYASDGIMAGIFILEDGLAKPKTMLYSNASLE